ncbi:MAG TPA: TIGR00282 family metallophosphoesterase [Spirochaetia bacterium]|nr:TIGR00282 family metallophosphoesterase [Spirochaetia bacterium]
MRVALVGDIIAGPGRRAVRENLPSLITDLAVDVVVANGENAAGGIGITREVAAELLDMGTDVITMGNHAFGKKEIISYIEQEKRILRPANLPPGAPGRGAVVVETRSGGRIAVISLVGRTFMQPLDCPFRAADAVLASLPEPKCPVVVDFHAEATSEKMALGWYLDGRVLAVTGTHTHVQTADERVLPGGTAFISDIGMCGPVNSVIGMDKDIVVRRFLTGLHSQYQVAGGPYVFSAVVVECDDATGLATGIRRIQNYEE